MAEDVEIPRDNEKQDRKSKDVIGTVQRVIRLLQYVGEEGQFNIKDAAASLNLPPSTVHRMLQFFARVDLVERDTHQHYRISREYFRLGSLAVQKFDLNQAAHPHLVELVERFGETASFALYLPGRHEGMIVDNVPTSHPLQYRIEPFKTWPLIWGSLGRVMLAFLPEEAISHVLADAKSSPATDEPAPTAENLAVELASIRAHGHYVSVSQRVLGATGTSAPVLGLEGRVIGSIGITTPLQRYRPEMQREITREVTRHARELSEALGYTGDIKA